MKKWISVVLAVLLVCAGMAQAAEWPDGKSPSKPYSNLPEINLNENIGYMVFSPSVIFPVQYACQRLYIYLPREDVKAGDGTLHIYTTGDKEVWSTVMTNAVAITARALTEEELTGLMWGSGTCFEIKLPKTLEVGAFYYVNLDRNCIVTEDGGLDNPAVTGSGSWSFSVGGAFGVSNMEYLRDGETALFPMAGDTIRFNLQLGGDAASAMLVGYNDSVNFYNTMFTESAEVTGSVTGSSPEWAVRFMDASGNEIQVVEFY